MAVFQIMLFILFALGMSTMFSGFMLARRMGMYLMSQVMTLMIAMLVAMIALLYQLLFPPAMYVMFDLLHILLIVDFIFLLVATLMEFGKVLPILLKTMQGGPIHSSHISNLLVTLFLALGMVLYYTQIALV
ncbi:MAG: hypothetical protein C4K47_08950 [Candidatus Thorarchaeota archaeon]|nr:MAG: hypothetical protein C4K47_08950 [Candidatus Thorarchaeota archaeon]